MANLGCIDLNPHPVRADDLDHPDELRVDLDPVPGVEWAQIVPVALVAREVLEDFGLTGWPKTSGSRGIHIYARIEPRWTFTEVRRRRRGAGPGDRAPGAATLATAQWWKEERHGVFVDYNQNAKDRTVASAYSVRPTPDARVSAPLTWDEVPDCDPAEFTIDTVPARFAALGDPSAGIDDAAGSLEPLLELAAAHEAAGLPDAPWPPHYDKQEGEAPRVQPSKRRAPARAAPPRPASRAARAAGGATTTPLIEVARAATQGRGAGGPGALEGAPPGGRGVPGAGRRAGRLDARPLVHLVPDPAQPAPRARGRAARPGGLEVDYDPWEGVEDPRLRPPDYDY